ncbi:interleukin-1 receptor type 2-like isoform X1 [Alosa alosa]|uniref:interleukin-1 receptor type 2-like isoform X1 n=1 Tax=Alosa alosa TaxID=278164 RepID=UPI00201522F1|nr:interleukin-1 receptor type 2-like isoform X1 [Alosa alosa]
MRSATGFVGFLLLIASSSCNEFVMHEGQMVESVYGTEGQVSWLECEVDVEENNLTVIWARDNQTLDTSTSRIRVQGAMLWFLSAEKGDSGMYTCRESLQSPVASQVFLSVSSKPCPQPSLFETVQQGTNMTLLCRQDEISQIALVNHIRWLKDCKPIDSITLVNIMPGDAGNYTCVISLTYEGRSYLASQSTWLEVKNDPPLQTPKVTYPKEDTIYIFPDQPANLTCIASLGYDEEIVTETISYWTVNNSFIDNYPELKKNTHSTIEIRDGMYYSASILSITVVQQEFFHVPFRCKFDNPVGTAHKDLWLKPISTRVFQSCLIILAALILAIIAVVCFSRCC